MVVPYLNRECAMTNVVASGPVTGTASEEGIAAELEAYNRAFSDLELPWRWDVRTFHDLIELAPDRDFVGVYVERNQAHLLRVYEKSFLRDLVHSARDRYLQEC
jgi:hypothetical protein